MTAIRESRNSERTATDMATPVRGLLQRLDRVALGMKMVSASKEKKNNNNK